MIHIIHIIPICFLVYIHTIQKKTSSFYFSIYVTQDLHMSHMRRAHALPSNFSMTNIFSSSFFFCFCFLFFHIRQNSVTAILALHASFLFSLQTAVHNLLTLLINTLARITDMPKI